MKNLKTFNKIKLLKTSSSAFVSVSARVNKDINPNKHLGSYVNVNADQLSKLLIAKSINRNYAIHDYAEIQQMSLEIIDFLTNLFNGSRKNNFGIITIGSSEAIMLALLCHIYKFIERGQKPNIIIPSNVHTCIIKFAKYFGCELKVVPIDLFQYKMDVSMIKKNIDQNTAAVVAILGSTFTGHLDDVQRINQILEEVQIETGLNIPLHIDSAIGGFVVPFVEPNIVWDFRLSHVASINVSNSKFGLVYPGMGTLIFKDKSYVPPDLMYDIEYLGKKQTNFSLNFSRNSFNIVQQTYNIKSLGFNGYKQNIATLLETTAHLKKFISSTGELEIINDENIIPSVYFKPINQEKVSLSKLSADLKKHGYILPVYNLPPNAEAFQVSRIVVKPSLTRGMIKAIKKIIAQSLKN